MNEDTLPRAKMLYGRLPKANDKGTPKDELLLAKLIQNAAGNGLASTRGTRFVSKDGNNLSPRHENAGRYVMWRKAPPNATGCCALGAGQLRPMINLGEDVVGGNDTTDTGTFGWINADPKWLTIGAAFEQALRPEVTNAG